MPPPQTSGWFPHRYALAHALLTLAGRRGCVDYRGEIFANFTYKEIYNARHALGPGARGGAFGKLFLTCEGLRRAECTFDFCAREEAAFLPGLRHQSVDVAHVRTFKYRPLGAGKTLHFSVNDMPAANKSHRVYLRELGLDGVDADATLFPPG